MSACTERCWTPVECPTHGNRMTPRGRSVALEEYQCCENSEKSVLNPRHLWDEHDSTRWYTDPEGWTEHEASCLQCKRVSS